MIGMDIGKSLEPMKGEIDSATIKRAIDDMLNGKEPLLTQEQGMLIMQTFSERMQAKQQEEMAAQSKKNLDAQTAFLAENSKKPGVVTTAVSYTHLDVYKRQLWNDPGTGVMRHADAGYEIAKQCAREMGLKLPMVYEN